MLRRILLVVLCGLILSQALLAQGGQFIQAPQYTVGASPLAAAVGDLNKDGKPDIVVTNKVDSTISVLLNKGDGTFSPQVTYDVGGIPASVAIADFNGDGSLDVVVTLPVVNNAPASQVAVLLGNGDGTLKPYVLYNTGLSPQFVAAQDLNGDGRPDLVVANSAGNSVSVLLNDGSGRFPGHTEYGTGVAPLAVVIADFNGDHRPDVAVANSGGNDPLCGVSSLGTISVLLGNGDGTFQPQRVVSVGYLPDAMAAADLNGDGKVDLAVGNFNGTDVSILVGNGNGTFQPEVRYATAPYGPYGIVAADFNHDNKIDLAVANASASSVSILLGNGDGTFQSHHDYWAGNGAGMLALGDFDGDSNLDLAVPDLGWADRPDNKLSILFGNGDGTFRSHVLYPTDITPGSVAIGDLNGDGIADLVIGVSTAVPEGPDCGCAKVIVILGKADGTYDAPIAYPTGRFPASVAVGDFNKDGILDIVVANYGTIATPDSTVGVLLGNGDGTFQPQLTYSVGNNPLAIAVADVNSDGNLDLVVSNSGDPTSNVGVLLGNGDGTFQAEKTSPLPGKASALSIADLNHDGKQDLVVVLNSVNRVATLLGDGNGVFTLKGQYAAGAGPVSVVTGDLNGDGNVDVAVVNQSAATLGILLGTGDGTLQPQVAYATPNQPTVVVAGDFNGDSKLDLLVASQYANSISLFPGTGDGTVSAPITYGTGWQPLALAAADLNGDGALDVVSANPGANSASVILNARGTVVA